MSRVSKLLRTPVPQWPFRWGNSVIFPPVLLFLGAYRVWATAATPFEEYLGITATAGLALLWSLVFGRVQPSHRVSSEIA